MKTINLKLKYKIGEKDIESGLTPEKVTAFLFMRAVEAKHEKGMPRTDSKLWVKLQDATEDAEDAPLEDAVFTWIYDLLKEYKPLPSVARWYELLMEHMEELKEKKEE